MNSSLKALALVAATAAATTAIVLPTAAQSQATPAAAPAPQLVANLPDFTGLVQQVGPGVVNVVAKVSRKVSGNDGMPDDMPEIFRRFFGPGMPFPGGPGQRPRAEEGTSIGSGFIISADGYVLTNNHVVDGATTVTVKLSDRREFTAKVVGKDKNSDVALLKINASNLPALQIGDSNQLRPGQWVVAIGSPFGLDHSVTAGIVSAVGRNTPQFTGQQYVPFIQTDVAINQGNSGGPLLNTRGQVVGINSQIFSNSGGYMGVSFAIPIDTAMSAVKQLKATGKVQYSMIGVGLQQLTPELAKANQLPDSNGALVRDIAAGGPAEKAGMQPGDVIRSVNGTPVYQMSDLPPMVGAMAPGTRITLGIYRGGKARDVQVTLAPLDQRLQAGLGQSDDGDDNGGTPKSATGTGNALGIVGQDLDADDRRQLGLKPGEGVGVAAVRGVAARSSGLQPGDVILQVGQARVGSASALDRELAKARAGQSVMLLVNRNGSTQFIAVAPHGANDQDDDSDDDQ